MTNKDLYTKEVYEKNPINIELMETIFMEMAIRLQYEYSQRHGYTLNVKQALESVKKVNTELSNANVDDYDLIHDSVLYLVDCLMYIRENMGSKFIDEIRK